MSNIAWKISVALLGGLCGSGLHAADIRSTAPALKCTATPFPAIPTGEDGYGIFGVAELLVSFAEGRVTQAEAIVGRAELIDAAKAALDGYRCDKAAAPLKVPMTFEFINPWAKKTLAFPLHDSRTSLAASNSIIRRYFPTRFDAIHEVATAEAVGYAPPRPQSVVRPEIDAAAARLGGDWTVEYQFIVEADGVVTDVAAKPVVPGQAHPLVVRLGAAALRKSKFDPATYKGKPIPIAMVHLMTLKLD
ncbi:hypothetical protein HNQ51_002921 [Inhella inkyongensis]|uniref:TonB C-terminal domain-containing protein n=1 Tax=Inhella inkyongensis TaxID=392593 RepID=A0A840S9Y4_9BURK|nr:hypothetical protein [Inhella inkyongensis]MBB5205594.1 hypothetical protein [Inhella inkyongensis]